MSKRTALATAVRAAERTLGRARVAKLARFVTNEIRLDRCNDMRINGEALVQRTARKMAHPVVFDVGCHFGEWTSSLLAQPGNSTLVHAFEPSASSAARARAALGEAAVIHQVAMSSTKGRSALQIVHEGAGSNSLVPFTDKARMSGGVEVVELNTVDDFAAAQGIDEITLLKIDAEGHDLEVMRGASEHLRRNRIHLVQFEYNLRWIDARLFLLDAFELLTGHGYRLGKVTPRGIETYERWHPELESFREANYLAYLPQWSPALKTFPWWGPG